MNKSHFLRSLLLGFIVVISACSQQKISAHNFRVLEQGNYGKKEQSHCMQIDNVKDWKTFWLEVHPGSKELPEIDFKKHKIAVFYAGRKRSGGYRMKINKTNFNKNEAIFEIVVIPPSGMATMMMTSPFLVVEIPKSIRTITANYDVRTMEMTQ